MLDKLFKREGGPAEQEVMDALRRVQEPEIHKDVVTLNMIKDVRVEGGKVAFTVELIAHGYLRADAIEKECRAEVMKVSGVRDVSIRRTVNVPENKRSLDKSPIPGVKNIIAVTSGKGGVGKTTVAVNLAIAMARRGARVGLLDADIYGPNVPIMMGLKEKPRAGADQRIQPLEKYDIKVMSMGFLMEGDNPVIWRGPMIHQAVQTFLRQVSWGELDYLVIDLPPGTGDAQLTLIQSVPLAGGVVVTTPQDVALSDARKGIMMFRQLNVEVLGVVENMSYFKCPHCGERSEIFSHGGGAKTAEKFQAPFLGAIPLDTQIREGGDTGAPIVIGRPESPVTKAFIEVGDAVAARVSVANLTLPPKPQAGPAPSTPQRPPQQVGFEV